MIPRSLLPGARVSAQVLLVAGGGIPAFGLVNPGGATGDLHRAAVVLLGGVAALLLAWHRLQAPEAADLPRRGDRLLLVPFLLVLGAALGQLVPLPPGLVELLAPPTARIHAQEAAAAGSPTTWRPLSLEPVATLRAACLGAAYLACALALLPVARRPGAARRLAWTMAGLGALATFLALAGLADAASPAQWRGRPTHPFVNPNHLCTFLVLALGPALGALLVPLEAAAGAAGPARGGLSRRGLVGLAVALIVTGVLLTRSRAGAVAGGLTAALALAPRLRAGQRLAVVLVVLALGGGLFLGDPDPLRARFDAEELRMDTLGGRVENWGVAVRVIAGRPLAGAGLGTFRDASVAALTSDRAGNTRPGEAHDDYLELLAGVGLPAGALALLGAGLVLALAWRRAGEAPPRARAVAQGALAGLAGGLFQELFDFGFQVPGPALAALACLALAWGAAPPHETHPAPAGAGPLRRAAPPLLAGLLLCGAGLALLRQAGAEATARGAFERARGRGVPEELRPELFRRAERVLALADVPGARADVAWLRLQAQLGAGERQGAEAVERSARAAAARAPGRAEHQAGLGIVLLEAGRQRRAAALVREGDGRMQLALELGPTTPSVLLAGGEWRLDRLARTGDPAEAAQAEALLRAALEREPGLRPRVHALLARRVASLGEAGERLRGGLLGPTR